MLCPGLKRALEARRETHFRTLSTRPDIDLAGGRGGSERSKYIKKVMYQGGGPGRVDSGSRQGLRESQVPDRAERGMRAQASEAFDRLLPKVAVGLAYAGAKRLQ